MSRPRVRILCLALGVAASRLPAQTMSIEEYEPKSTLVVPEHKPSTRSTPSSTSTTTRTATCRRAEAAQLVADMDRINMRVMVNLSGAQGAEFEKGYRNLPGRYPGRFVVFANLDYKGIETPGWGERAAAQLDEDVRHGARGLKIFKNLGLSVDDASGPARAGRRPAARPGLGQVRRARHPGADPLRASRAPSSSRRTSTTSAGWSSSSFPSAPARPRSTRPSSRS